MFHKIFNFFNKFIGYWPDCHPPRTCGQEGKTGTYPNCHGIVVVHHCAAHMSGNEMITSIQNTSR